MSDPIEQAAAVAARWWREAVAGPVVQHAGDAFLDMMGTVMAAQDGRPSDATANAFEAALQAAVADRLRRHGSVYLDVDYDPCRMLHDAWGAAAASGCLRWPWKTSMSVRPGDVTVSAGYRAPDQRLLGPAIWQVMAYRPAIEGEEWGDWWTMYCGTAEEEARYLYAMAVAALPAGGATRDADWRADRPSVMLTRDGSEVVMAAEGERVIPWNWCPTCKSHVDDDMRTGAFFDGSTGTCMGCRTVYVAVAWQDGSWSLVPADDGEEEDGDNG